jgi:hypothetical protein
VEELLAGRVPECKAGLIPQLGGGPGPVRLVQALRSREPLQSVGRVGSAAEKESHDFGAARAYGSLLLFVTDQPQHHEAGPGAPDRRPTPRPQPDNLVHPGGYSGLTDGKPNDADGCHGHAHSRGDEQGGGCQQHHAAQHPLTLDGRLS